MPREKGSSYCALHKAQREKSYEQDRGTAAARGYDAEWQAKRAAYLRAHPRCVQCGAPATEAHHVRPKRAGGTDEWSNLRALCKSCHSAVTAKAQAGR
jgi:5-methylcytosine-specific restriction enzyme A